jgi:hypothetical protein
LLHFVRRREAPRERNSRLESLLRERTRPSPASLEILAKVSVHMTTTWPMDLSFTADEISPESRAQSQSIVKATIIKPKMPTAMIAFVVLSIVASSRPPDGAMPRWP